MSPRRALHIASSLSLLALFVLALIWLAVAQSTRNGANEEASHLSEPYLPKSIEKVKETEQKDGSPVRNENPQTGISVDRVIDQWDCRLFAGIARASHLGVVRLPSENGAEYAVLDSTGVLFEGTLPFSPHHVRVGMRSDSSVLVGFGDLRLNSGDFRPVDSREPVRILHDNQVIFKSDKVLDFDIASDGSSFAVHEPTPGGTTRLIIRNLDTGKQSHYDLETRFEPINDYERGYMLRYAIDEKEIVFEPSHVDALGLGTYWFYPVGEGEVHEVSISTGISAVLASSTEGYFTEYATESDRGEVESSYVVYRRAMNPSTAETKVMWKRELSLKHYYGTMSLSDNGKWMALKAWNLEILDTNTGESVFRFPMAGNPKERLRRLSSVVPENTRSDELGRLGGSTFSGDKLIFHWAKGNTLACATRSGHEYDAKKHNECVQDLGVRGLYSKFYDVFDLSSVGIDGGPSYRVTRNLDSACSIRTPPFKGLGVDGDELKYFSLHN